MDGWLGFAKFQAPGLVTLIFEKTSRLSYEQTSFSMVILLFSNDENNRTTDLKSISLVRTDNPKMYT